MDIGVFYLFNFSFLLNNRTPILQRFSTKLKDRLKKSYKSQTSVLLTSPDMS